MSTVFGFVDWRQAANLTKAENITGSIGHTIVSDAYYFAEKML